MAGDAVCKTLTVREHRMHSCRPTPGYIRTPISGDRDVRFEDGQVTSDSAFAHERAEFDTPAITERPRVLVLRYPVTKFSVVCESKQ
jgi:hypothetical protein